MDATRDESQMAESSRAKVWLVTGCSSGFGQSLVPAILARGDKVIATARQVSDLGYLKDVKNVAAIQLDVTAPNEVLCSKVEEAVAKFGTIDVLVNNAGYVLSGVWEELRYDLLKLLYSAIPMYRCDAKSDAALRMSSGSSIRISSVP